MPGPDFPWFSAMRRAIPFFLLLTLSCPLGARAAEPDPARLQAAAEEFDEGTKAFKRKEYEEAAAHFEAADRYAPSPASLGNAIKARKAAKQLARAATLATLG